MIAYSAMIRQQGREAERAATLAFLRGGYGKLQMMVSGAEARDLADAIERGDHIKEGENQ
jgi:hypothetical protein